MSACAKHRSLKSSSPLLSKMMSTRFLSFASRSCSRCRSTCGDSSTSRYFISSAAAAASSSPALSPVVCPLMSTGPPPTQWLRWRSRFTLAQLLMDERQWVLGDREQGKVGLVAPERAQHEQLDRFLDHA